MDKTKEYLMKSAEQELDEVIAGTKPAALGFWPINKLRGKVSFTKLKPVYGRYYKYAIGYSKEKLKAVVKAYYMPISPGADMELGRALGYNEESIHWYTNSIHYQPEETKYVVTSACVMADILSMAGYNIKPHHYKKILSTMEKQGVHTTMKIILELIAGDPMVLHVAKKERLI